MSWYLSNKKEMEKNTFSGTKLFSDNQRGKVIVSCSFTKKNIQEMYLKRSVHEK